MKKTSLAALPLLVIFFIAGCSPLKTAQNFQNVIAGVIAIAKVDAPALPAQDQAVLTPWINFLSSADTQLQTCITAAGTNGKKATFLACFNAFANPTELATLRVISAKSQSSAVLWITAIVVGVNAGLDFFGGAQVPPPVIQSASASKSDLHNLFVRDNVPPGLLERYGY
jgi:hypothetical protein